MAAADGALLDRPSVRRVRDALEAKGAAGEVVALAETARSAADAARALGVEAGAIVKSLVFTIDDEPVVALIAGDRDCDPGALPAVLGRAGGSVARADAALVRRATGFSIGGVAPIAHPKDLPTVIDSSLSRFGTVYAAAGHPHCVFATTFDELCRLTDGRADDRAGRPRHASAAR